jgi:hypothetical protein
MPPYSQPDFPREDPRGGFVREANYPETLNYQPDAHYSREQVNSRPPQYEQDRRPPQYDQDRRPPQYDEDKRTPQYDQDKRQEEQTGLILGGDSEQRKLEQKRRMQEEYAEYLRSQQVKARQPEPPNEGGAFVIADRDDKAEKQRRYREGLDQQLQGRLSDASTDSRSSTNSRAYGELAVETSAVKSQAELERDRRRIAFERKQQYAEELKAQMQAKQRPLPRQETAGTTEPVTRNEGPKSEKQSQYRQELQTQIEEKKRRVDEERRQREEEEMRIEQRLQRDNPVDKPTGKQVTKDPNRPSDDHPDADRYKQLMHRKLANDADVGRGKEDPYSKPDFIGVGSSPIDQLQSRPPAGYPPSHNFPPYPPQQYVPMSQALPPGQGQPYVDSYAMNREIQEMQRDRDRSKEQILELKEMMLKERERALYEISQEMHGRAQYTPGSGYHPQYPPQEAPMHPPVYAGYPTPIVQHVGPAYPPQAGYLPHGYPPQPGFPPPAGYPLQPSYPSQPSYAPQSRPSYPPAPYQPSAIKVSSQQPYNDDNIMSFSHKIDLQEPSSHLMDQLLPPNYPPSKADSKPFQRQDSRVTRDNSATFNPDYDEDFRPKADLLRSREIESTYHNKAVKEEGLYSQDSARATSQFGSNLFEKSLSGESKWVRASNMQWGNTKLLDSVAEFKGVKPPADGQRKPWQQSTDPFKMYQSIKGQEAQLHQLRSDEELEESLPSYFMHVPFKAHDEAPNHRDISEQSVEEDLGEDEGNLLRRDYRQEEVLERGEDFEAEGVLEEEGMEDCPRAEEDESCTVQVGLMSEENSFADKIAKNFEEAESSSEEECKAVPSQAAVRPTSMSNQTRPKTLDVFKAKPRDFPGKPTPTAVTEVQSTDQHKPFYNLKDARARHKAAKQQPSTVYALDAILEQLRGPPNAPPTSASKFTQQAPSEVSRAKKEAQLKEKDDLSKRAQTSTGTARAEKDILDDFMSSMEQSSWRPQSILKPVSQQRLRSRRYNSEQGI